MNANPSSIAICVVLVIGVSAGCQQPQSVTKRDFSRDPATLSEEEEVFEVLEVTGKVRATLTNADPLCNEGWFKICKGDLLRPETLVVVPIRGRLKIGDHSVDPPVVYLLDNMQLSRLCELSEKTRNFHPNYGEIRMSDSNRGIPQPGATCDLRSRFPRACPLHQVTMREDTVPVLGGLRCFDLNDLMVKASHAIICPQSNRNYESGICGDRQSYAQVRYCPLCRKTEARWRNRTHGPSGKSGTTTQATP